MGVEYAVILERSESARVPDEAELRAYYDEHCPPGSPPFETLVDAIRHAVIAARPADPDPLRDITSAFDGRRTRWIAGDIDLLAEIHGWPLLHSFVVHHQLKYFPASEGLDLFEPLVARIRAELAGEERTHKPRRRGDYLPIHKHAETWEYSLEELDAYAELLRAAQVADRRFRVEIFS